MWGSPAHPGKDFIGGRRSASTECFTSTGLRFLVEIHDRPLQECGQEGGIVCMCVFNNMSTFCIYVCTPKDVFVLGRGPPKTLKPGRRELTLEGDLVGALKDSRGSSCKKYKFAMRERRTSIRKEHWSERLYYCQRFTLYFIPNCHS